MPVYYPNAKINLGLHIGARRADGYHTLQTIFYPIPLHDRLVIEPAEDFSFQLDGAPLDCTPEQNLVVRALRLLEPDGSLPPLHVELGKHIPSGAGLGGGSSDAAFALRAARDIMGSTLTDDDLAQCLTHLGADCPFFLRNSPVYATGIGEVMTGIDLSLSGWNMLLVKPDIYISTGEAYGAIDRMRQRTEGTPHNSATTTSLTKMPLTEIVRRPVQEWPNLLHNDFEPWACEQHQQIADIRQMLYDLGAAYAAMSGSGSALFGLFAPGTEKPDFIDNHIQPTTSPLHDCFLAWLRL